MTIDTNVHNVIMNGIMMFRCEHFVYGLFDSVGYRTLKSPRVDDVLSEKNLDWLRQLRAKPDPYVHWLATEQLVAVSQVRPAQDEYGRGGAWNHTILIRADDYVRVTQKRSAEWLYGCFFTELPSPHDSLVALEMVDP